MSKKTSNGKDFGRWSNGMFHVIRLNLEFIRLSYLCFMFIHQMVPNGT